MSILDFLFVLILVGMTLTVLELLVKLAAPYNTIVRIVFGIVVFWCFLSVVGMVAPIHLGIHAPRFS